MRNRKDREPDEKRMRERVSNSKEKCYDEGVSRNDWNLSASDSKYYHIFYIFTFMIHRMNALATIKQLPAVSIQYMKINTAAVWQEMQHHFVFWSSFAICHGIVVVVVAESNSVLIGRLESKRKPYEASNGEFLPKTLSKSDLF